jgi:hypothetical protein
VSLAVPESRMVITQQSIPWTSRELLQTGSRVWMFLWNRVFTTTDTAEKTAGMKSAHGKHLEIPTLRR